MHDGQAFFQREANQITPVRYGKKLEEMSKAEVFEMLSPFAGQKRRSLLGNLFQKGKSTVAQSFPEGYTKKTYGFHDAKNFIEYHFPFRSDKKMLPVKAPYKVDLTEMEMHTILV